MNQMTTIEQVYTVEWLIDQMKRAKKTKRTPLSFVLTMLASGMDLETALGRAMLAKATIDKQLPQPERAIGHASPRENSMATKVWNTLSENWISCAEIAKKLGITSKQAQGALVALLERGAAERTHADRRDQYGKIRNVYRRAEAAPTARAIPGKGTRARATFDALTDEWQMTREVAEACGLETQAVGTDLRRLFRSDLAEMRESGIFYSGRNLPQWRRRQRDGQ